MTAQTGAPAEVEVVWEGGLRFRGGGSGGPKLLLDGDGAAAPSPVQALAVSLAACSGIDVVEILAKRRARPESLRVQVRYRRAETPPRRLTEVVLRFSVTTAENRAQVERAVTLSLEKYCSVTASLAPDTRISWELELEPLG